MNGSATTLTNSSRWLVRSVAVLFAILGIVLFVAPTWAAENFLWKISPFVAMTMGGWYLGNAFFAWEAARIWRWPIVYACLIYLWAFGLLEAAVLVAHRSLLRLDAPLGWPYMIVIGVAVIAAVKNIIDWVQLRPALTAEGPPVPLLLRIASAIFALFVFTLGIFGPGSFGLDGSIFPEPLTPFTVYAFAAFYSALGFGAVALMLGAKGLAPVLAYARCGLPLIIVITIAALVYIGLFDFGARPLGLLYFAAYIVVGIAAAILVLRNRADRQALATQPG
jgi:hypothetical protein